MYAINENVTNQKQEVDEILVVNRAVAAVAVPAPVVAYVVHGALGGEERLRLGGRVARQRDQRHHGEAGGGLLHHVAVLDRLELSKKKFRFPAKNEENVSSTYFVFLVLFHTSEELKGEDKEHGDEEELDGAELHDDVQ